QGNKAIFTATHTTPGVYEYKGTIRVPSPDGSVKEYPFSQSYQVSAPTAVVSADKMNVLYIGVDNPISVSVPGIPRESIRASISSGSLSGGNGNYTARVSEPGTAVISVSAEVGGEVRALGSQTFRVRTVPPPIPKFGGISSGALNASVAKVQPGVFAVLENFDFDMQFTVTRFTMIISRRRADPFVQTANSNALTPQMKQALNTVAAGDVIAIDDIYVKGGDGTNRKLEQGIAIRIQQESVIDKQMKAYILTGSLLIAGGQVWAQTPQSRDKAYEEDSTIGAQPIPYPYLREADVMWEK